MKLPISLQIARAVLVKVKNQTLAIPMAVVDQIGRLDYYQTVALPVPAIELRGERYPAGASCRATCVCSQDSGTGSFISAAGQCRQPAYCAAGRLRSSCSKRL